MTTLVLGPRPPELQALIDRRRLLGLDGHDEVWDGVYHVAPHAHTHHGVVADEIKGRIFSQAKRAGLVPGDSFNVGQPHDFRVPDGGYHRAMPDGVYASTAALLLEVLSPDDETFAKFGFYAEHGVEELIVADPAARTVRCWHLTEGEYVEHPRSALLGLSMAGLAAEVDWPS